jgi:archaeosortase A (PGF-CTERM-specific)
VVAGFGASALVDAAGEGPRAQRVARGVAAAAWVSFGVFWLLLVDHYALTQKSIIEGVGSAVAVPLSLYVAYLVWTERPSLLFLSRAVAVMGAIYLPFQTVPALETAAIEAVTAHAKLLMETLGYDPHVVSYGEHESVFRFHEPWNDLPLDTPVLLACSGIGSIATVSGLVLAVREPLRKRLAALAVVVPVIYALNVVRVAFIVLAFSKQWLQVFVPQVMAAFGTGDRMDVSYYVADRIIAQSLSVVVLLVMVWALLQYLPAMAVYVEEVAYLLTGEELDLRDRLAAGE